MFDSGSLKSMVKTYMIDSDLAVISFIASNPVIRGGDSLEVLLLYINEGGAGRGSINTLG